MSKREGDGEIGVEVHRVPPLASHPSPGRADGRHRNGKKQREAHDRHEDIGVVLHEVDGLSDDGLTASSRVPKGDEHDVASEERDGREPSPSMPDRETIEPDRALEPPDARHEQELEQHDVRAEEACELTDCCCDAARSTERVEAAVAEPQPDDHDRWPRSRLRCLEPARDVAAPAVGVAFGGSATERTAVATAVTVRRAVSAHHRKVNFVKPARRSLSAGHA